MSLNDFLRSSLSQRERVGERVRPAKKALRICLIGINPARKINKRRS
jgi:hypothetical protein